MAEATVALIFGFFIWGLVELALLVIFFTVTGKLFIYKWKIILAPMINYGLAFIVGLDSRVRETLVNMSDKTFEFHGRQYIVNKDEVTLWKNIPSLMYTADHPEPLPLRSGKNLKCPHCEKSVRSIEREPLLTATNFDKIITETYQAGSLNALKRLEMIFYLLIITVGAAGITAVLVYQQGNILAGVQAGLGAVSDKVASIIPK